MNLLALLNYLKAFASLAGAVATALLAVYVGNPVLTVIAVVSTAVVTWAAPNDLAERLAGEGGAHALDEA